MKGLENRPSCVDKVGCNQDSINKMKKGSGLIVKKCRLVRLAYAAGGDTAASQASEVETFLEVVVVLIRTSIGALGCVCVSKAL